MRVNIGSLYLCVLDMDRAIQFYEELFEMPVTERHGIYSVFEVNGFRFGLFAFEKMKEHHSFGNNCLPSIDVPNLEALQLKLAGKEVVFPVCKIGKNWVSEFMDSEGNHLELTAPL